MSSYNMYFLRLASFTRIISGSPMPGVPMVLSVAAYYSIVCIRVDHNFSVHSSFCGRLGYSSVLAVTNNIYSYLRTSFCVHL